MILEIRTYRVADGRLDEFVATMRSVVPVLTEYGIDVVAAEPSQRSDEGDHAVLLCAFDSYQQRDELEAAFHRSEAWCDRARAAVLDPIESYHTVVLDVPPMVIEGLRQIPVVTGKPEQGTEPFHLVLIFGPGAVGKMTVGRELCDRTGYKLFHNHLSIDPVVGIFDFGTPAFTRVCQGLRRSVITEAIAAGLPGLVFTFMWDFSTNDDRDYLETLLAPVRAAGGRIDFVELYADQSTRLAREGSVDRVRHKPTKSDPDAARALTKRLDEELVLNTDTIEFPYSDSDLLRLDTTDTPPGVNADRIVEHLGLSAPPSPS